MSRVYLGPTFFRSVLPWNLSVALVLLLLGVQPAAAQRQMDQVPEGLTPTDWQSIRAAYEAEQQAYLKASNTGVGDYFGHSVAVSGDTVVVGAPREDSSTTGVNSSPNESAPDSGAAYVFVRSGTLWTQQAYLKASNAGAGDRFGSSVSVSGDTVVVGAPAEASSTNGVNSTPNESAPASGAAYVFVRSGTLWAQQAYLKASNTGQLDRFGLSVSVSGDTVVVGAWLEDSSTTGVNSTPNDSAADSGAAYVFVRNGTLWAQQAYLKASNTGANDGFGYSVSVSGDTVALGAHLEASSTTGVNSTPNNSASASGAAYVFVRTGTSWTQQAYLKAGNTGSGDLFGASVSVSGDTVVVGAPSEDSSTTGVNGPPNELAWASGAAYVFLRSGTSWTQQAFLKASNTGESDSFGSSVSVSGDTIVVGAILEDSSTTGVNSTPNDSALDSGAAYVFLRSGTLWTQQAYLKASNTGDDDVFGWSVSVSGDLVVVGAYAEDSGTTGVNSTPNESSTDSGAVYVFVRIPQVPDAPTVGTAIAGNTTVTVTFTALVSDGGSPITGYTATCGTQSASGASSPITVTGLTNGVPVTCTVVATNAVGDSEPSAASNSVTPATPRIRVPASTAMREGDAVSIPVELLPAGLSLSGVSASLDYDQTCLTPDADNNGLLDQVTWSAPAGFTTIASFDALDTDGEIDLSIVDVNPPIAALPDGVLVQIQFQAICPVPGAEVAAPIVFSSAPTPTFGDVLANNVFGDWTDGIVRILGGPAGDCNGDNLIGIADLTAIGFEIFDGDGEFWLDAPQPTYPGSPVGCDANASTLIQAADVTCANLLIFGGTCEMKTAQRAFSAPLIEVSTDFEAPLVWLRARLQKNANAVASLAFSFDLDRNLFDLAQVDLNQDGRIDHLRFPQGEPDLAMVRWDPNDSGGEMDFLLADLSQQQLADGILVEVGIPAAQPQSRGLFFSAAPAPSFGSISGSDLPGIAVEGLLLFMDGFESGDTDRWSGTLLASAIPITVPKETSRDPGLYRGGFALDPALFAGIEAGKETMRVFAVKENREASARFGMVVRWDGAGYQIRAWAEAGAGGALRMTHPVVLGRRPAELSFEWLGASGPGAQDGWLQVFADGVFVGQLADHGPVH